MEITTNTIAELYIKQGYPEKAIDIYKAILELDPSNSAAVEKIQKLEAGMRGETEQLVAPPVEPVAAPAVEPALQVNTANELQVEAPAQPIAAAAKIGGSSISDQIVRLENWLVNINRVRGLA
ncbi:MAG: tetratricopeptide repeat protein [bacterium]|nr:tetratricopeptide repeat protein [bacterium]